ncbi:hypothetical protein DTO169E5_1263 [Paecilomyces variotii]|nr:hypothetical protein DTO169C6_6553 [Paecilomyces variotii]KAJ9244882.1 hypothetical protein DTO169E5_1263 [Paecilomyces variotii]
MVNERQPPQGPVSPRKSVEKSSAAHPEFGKPSPLRPMNSQSMHLFNIPKPSQARPEHHRPAQSHSQSHHSQHGRDVSPSKLARTPGPLATPVAKRSHPFDPFKPVRPSEYNHQGKSSLADNDVFEIARPTNHTWTTPRAPRQIFSSKPNKTKMTSASNNLKNFIDLTTNEVGFATNSSHYREEVSAMDAYSYVDAAKANENIKALLEGAFEDEEDKPERRKGRKKSGKKKKQKAKRDRKLESDIDDLAAQLEGVNVNDTKAETETVKEDKGKEAANDKSGTDDEVKRPEQEEQEDHEEEEEEEGEDEGEDEEDEEEDDGTIEGLKVKLLPHQIDGVRWMRDKETGQKKTRGVLPKGGILADDMGLGKTVQAIALILTNRKTSQKDEETRRASDDDDDDDEEDQKEKAKLSRVIDKGTLVVAPLALIKQWESEIAVKVEDSHRLRVGVYHGAGRSKMADDLKKYDVVITTYGTLSSEHASSGERAKSGLFSVYWYRIILDEAHTIKNRNAKSTQAACALNAEYRWCLTGTPLQNNLDELQSLIKFLRIKPYNDLAAWREQITKPLNNGRGALAIKRLQVYLRAFMKRRTKDVLKLNDDLKPGEADENGEKKTSNGFQITKREVIKVDAEFTPAEMEFYKRLEQRTDRSLEKMMGGAKMDYTGALVLLLRLRQACNHPDLVKSDLADDKDVLLNNVSSKQSKAAKEDDLDSVADLFGGLSVVTKKCDVCQTELSREDAKAGGSRCAECEAELKSDVIAKPEKKKKKHKKHRKEKKQDTSESYHSLSEAQKARSRRNRRVITDSDDEDDGEWIVPEDQRAAPDLGKAGGSDDEDAEGGGEWINAEDSETDEDEIESPSRRRTGVISLPDTEDESDSEAETESEEELDDDEDDDVLASTKIRYLMRILKRESHDYKFIVFSFFTSMLDKVEPFLKRAGIGFSRYDGGMRNDMREASLEKLRHSRGTRVLLCSLRAGALGLNLTAASRVVLLEPFWNPFVEEQAIDRVHRLNQTLDVKIYKMTIKDTVEQRILDLQERKRELANATIEGKTAAGKLTMRDMMALFGRDAERFETDPGALELNQRTKLLAPRDEDEESGNYSRSISQSSSFSGQARRTTPPAMEKDRKKKPPRAEDSVYGRRW